MPPACEAVLRTVGGAGGGDYHHPNKTNKTGSRRTTKVVRCTANYKGVAGGCAVTTPFSTFNF